MTRMSIGTNQKYVNISLLYPPELLIKGFLKTQGAKTCTSMSESLEISHDILQKIIASNIKAEKELRQLLYSLVYVNYKPGTICYLIGDDSCIVKKFAQCLEGLNMVYDTAESDKTKGYKLVVLAWSNGETTIPIDFRFWFKANGKTKLELMQEMIMEWHKRIPFYVVLLDGLYASYDMMVFFDHIKIKFIMRLPKNRKVQDSKQNPEIAIGDNWRFKLIKNNRQKIFKAYIQGILRYITASKRRNRSGDYETVFFVSNFRKSASEILALYARRWNIEKFFRTAKQKLGLQDSQARTLDRQAVHVFACFAAFALADTIKVFEKFDSADHVIRAIRSQKIRPELYNPSTWRIFYELA